MQSRKWALRCEKLRLDKTERGNKEMRDVEDFECGQKGKKKIKDVGDAGRVM